MAEATVDNISPDERLARERRRLEMFARASGGWFWETDAENRFIYMSDSVEEVTGVKPEWHYGKTRQDIGIPQAVEQTEWERHLRDLRDHEPFESFKFQRVAPDGVKWMQTSGLPLFAEDGGFQGYQGVATDITAQVEAEHEARLLGDAIEQFSESFVLWGPDERLVICNRKFRELNHEVPDFITPGTLFRDHITAVTDLGLAAPVGRTNEEWLDYRLARFRDPGEPFEMRRQNGLWLWIIEQRMTNGATVTTATDITKVKRAEQEVARVYQQLQDAIETFPACFIAYDKDDRIVMTNTRYRESFNVASPEDIHGLTFENLLRTNLARGSLAVAEDEQEEWIAQRLKDHRNSGLLIEQRMSNGEYLRFIAGNTSDGGLIRFGMDISELKQKQAELEEARRLAEDANQAKSNFLAMISHEIRTPLNGILGMSYLLRGTPMDAQQVERLEHIIASGNSLQVIINDVLDMSKIEAGAIEIESVPFDMSALVASVSSLFGDLANEKGLRFKIGPLPEDARHLVGDPARVRQILWNLLSNAIKFTKDGTISMLFSRLPDKDPLESRSTLRVEVRDTGIGIEASRLESIFDPFVQADISTTRRFGGTGLGLSIIRHLVELMDGTIRVESEPGKGSCFTVEVPFNVTGVEEIEQHVALSSPNGNADGRVLNILVAEDHPLNAIVATDLLQRHGHTTTLAENGLKAVTAVHENSYDLILMDAHMPEMDGIEATRLIRNHPVHGKVPIIGLTADAFVDQHAALRNAGMDAVVTKPFTDDELLSVIWKTIPAGVATAVDDTPAADPPSPDWRTAGAAEFWAFARDRNPKLILQLLDLARSTTIERAATLRAAADDSDGERIHFAAHTIKGSAGTLFASRLSQLAHDIEANHADPEHVRSLLPAFQQSVEEALAWWDALEVEFSTFTEARDDGSTTEP